MVFLCVVVGGAAGAVARYALGAWVQARRPRFPWGTLVVNVTGAFALGLLLPMLAAHPVLKALVATGFLGAYTTFSTFSAEAALLVHDRDWRRAAEYVGATVVLGLAASFAGWWFASALLAR
ncbi:MAG: CrcB protein [Gemmatimonadetes bacterium]|nr:CrcB protein [Gemmatimonadota bacterium]